MAITSNDTVITAFAEYCYGPGWSNTPLWVIVRDANGLLRQESLQPDEQGADIRLQFDVSAAVHLSVKAAVIRQLAKPRSSKLRKR